MTIGPSTTQTPYLIASQPNVTFVSLVSAGDIIGTKPGGAPRPFAGTPDGIGAFDNGDGTVTVLVNHEFGATAGAVREHGSTGSFIDKLIIDKSTLAIVSSEDLIKTVFQDNDGDGVYVNATTAFERFCSSDLAPVSAFYNAHTNLGTTDRIYLTGEETAPPFTTEYGRAFATVLTGPDAGKAFELPALGNISFENQVANPASGDKTIIMEMDDTGNGSTTGGQVYMYVGTKQATGTTIEKAGLTNGQLYGVQVNGLLDEANGTTLPGDSATFTLGLLANAKTETGVQLQTDSEAANITEFLRPEDGAWDPSHPNWFYFNTTASFSGNSRLWRLEFNDLGNPTAGGTIRMLLNGTEGYKMLDNMTISADGKVTLLEDVGNNAYLGRVLQYDPATDTISELAIHDASRFAPGGANFITQDEEASGVIDVTSIFGNADRQAFLLDTQAHNSISGEVVEGGQLQLMFVDTPRNGGAGDDVINGGAGIDNLSGGGGNDTMRGGSSNDVLYGEAGNDTIDGGLGADSMIGGAGDDTYSVDNPSDQVSENANEGIDTVNASANFALSANVENLILQGSADLQGYGNALANSITGNSGNNLLDGGAGADVMSGGTGNDVYFVDNSGDTVAENANEGSDAVFSTVDFMLSANVETLVLQGSADLQGYGNSLSNALYGNSGNNLLDGRGSADVMYGAAGNDTYFVDNGGDVVVEIANEGNDAVFSTVDYMLTPNVEILVLQGSGNLQGYGNGQANALYGNTGNNLLDGGANADGMYGGAGNDTYFVDNAGDMVVENSNEGTDVVFSSVDYSLSADVEYLVLQGPGNLNGTGNALANNIWGNSSNNMLNGGAGADVLTGFAGNDTFVFNAGEANGDLVVDFSGNGAAAGDSLLFSGYGAGATFTNIDASHWQVNYNGGTQHDVITFSNAASIDVQDYLFV